MRRILCAIILCLPVLLSAVTTEERFTLSPAKEVVPYDRTIGKLTKDCASCPTVSAMLSSPYSLEWVETYVAPSVKNAFVSLYGKELASLLPQKDFLFGESRDGSVPVRLSDGRIMTLALYEGKLLSFSLGAKRQESGGKGTK
jgi:hypothetical protein